jgi:diguanylate cyclase
MDGASNPAAGGRAVAATPVASIAKGALRRLAQAHLEPTPENYARAYAEEAGQPPPAASGPAGAAAPAAPAAASAQELRAQGQAWAALLERVVRGLDRGGRQWTAARRKDSLKRVLEGSRSDTQRLLQRLQSLMGAWESDQAADPAQTGLEAPPPEDARGDHPAETWRPVLGTLQQTLGAALPPAVPRAEALADQFKRLADALASEGPTPDLTAACEALCAQARRFFGHRHHLIDELSALCRELTAGLVELAEDESWARGQAQVLQHSLEAGTASARGVRAAGALLAETRTRQQRVRAERQAARDALKQLIHDMVVEVGELGDHAGRFQLATAQHAQAIEQAQTLESLAQVVQALLQDTRTVQSAVGRSQERLHADRARADALEGKVRELEGELRRLSDEVSTDALTQVANRRGLDQAFEVERARCEREAGAALAVGLIDIDNFKKLNDSLGHAAGDQALKSLAAAVRERLRPVDHLARFGGEEFVLLLPGLPEGEAQQVMTRLQRSLSEALFLHDGREVFVTFSGGVTAWRAGETLQAALERADEALYEAKRTGKNRTCIA